MNDLNKVFGLDNLDANALRDNVSETDNKHNFENENTLDRIMKLRVAVKEKFGQAAMYDHPFFEEEQILHGNRTPYRMACESDGGLKEALEVLENNHP
jgi:hypothetical protein